jgi:hypothetical protein
MYIWIIVIFLLLLLFPFYLRFLSENWTLGKLNANLKFMKGNIYEKESIDSRKNA